MLTMRVPQIAPTSSKHGRVLNPLDRSVCVADIEFGVKAVHGVEHRLGYFPCFIQSNGGSAWYFRAVHLSGRNEE
jgi:hypothetical protein